MAYARFGRHSDVYVYQSSSGGWQCCRCSVEKVPSFNARTRSEMIAHLRSHLERGDKVPLEAIEELQSEIEKVGDVAELI